MADRAGSWRRLRFALAACACGLAAGRATAQVGDVERRVEHLLRQPDSESRLRADTSLSLTERTALDVGGSFTFTYVNLDDENQNGRGLLQYDTALYARVSVDNVHTFFGRVRLRYQDFTPGDSFDGRGDEWKEPFLDRYWYEFDLREWSAAYRGQRSAGDFNVRVGRQFVDWGSGLTLSEALYAVRPTFSFSERLSLEGLAGVTPGDESVVDFDASRDDYNRDTSRGFYGGMLRWTSPGGKQVYAYYLKMQDYNTDDTPRLALGVPVNFNYTADYVGVGATGSLGKRLLYEAEAVYEWGTSMSDPLRGDQFRESISAYAARGQLTWLALDTNQSRVQLETLLASGDRDRLVSTDTVGGNLAGTNDSAFNSLGLANTGLAFAPSLSNIISVRLGGSTFPARGNPALAQLQIGADVLVFGKAVAGGPIDEPTLARSYLGTEAEFFLNYRVFSDLSLGVRYGAFFPGAAIEGDHDVRHFVVVSVTLAF
jgi:hypothetical protein